MQTTAAYSEFIGISPRTSALIETFRRSPDEPKDEIIERALSGIARETGSEHTKIPGMLDLGEGAQAVVGERLYLFLSKAAKEAGKPDGVALVGSTAISMGAQVFPQRYGFLHAAMKAVQTKLKHVNGKGEVISLSAWRQWHVQRGDKLVPVVDLKNPALAKRRGGTLSTPLSLEDLGL